MKKQQGFTFLALLALIGVLLFAIWYIKSPYLAGGGLYLNLNKLSLAEEQELIQAGQSYQIEISSKGFIPEHLKVKQFDTITFINRDFSQHRPVGSAGRCASISSSRALAPSESYSFVLTKTGSCSFKDQLSSFPEGEIRVERLLLEKK